MKLLSCVQLFVTPLTVAYEVTPSMEFSPAKVLEWGAIAFSIFDGLESFFQGIKGHSRDQTLISGLAGGFFTTEPPEKPLPLFVKREVK